MSSSLIYIYIFQYAHIAGTYHIFQFIALADSVVGEPGTIINI